MTVGIPGEDRLPAGPLRDLVAALHELYRSAGKPGVRGICKKIKERDDLRDTVSHETISALLRGRGLPRWVKVECVVRVLADWTVDRADPGAEVRRFHALWLAASDASDGLPNGAPPEGRSPPASVITNLGTRNSRFTGRIELLAAIRTTLTDPARVPVVLHGVGGVGKTYLALEYAARWAAEYDLAWWIPAEQPSQIVAALAALGERLALSGAVDMRQTARGVLDALESSSLRWLLIYDNADLAEETAAHLPAAGGHVIVTSRNSAWDPIATPIEVDTFTRAESVDFLRRQATAGSAGEMDELAERLGDLPLALDQVSAMQSATGMPIGDYLHLFAEHMEDLLAAGRSGRAATVTTLVNVGFGRLRAHSPVAAQLLELLAFMAPDPVPITLLRAGSSGVLAAPLRRALDHPATVDRLLGQVSRYGLARLLREEQRIQVHRLVQLVLRDNLDGERARQIRLDVHRLLAFANPGKPDDARTWSMHAELGPHLMASDAIHSNHLAARRAVLDQIRFLERVGDFEASARLAEAALISWESGAEGGLGLDHELTVLATRHLANARRALGHYDPSRKIIMGLLERLRTSERYGMDHPHTLDTATVASSVLRITGAYEEALELDREVVERWRRLRGETDRGTLTARANLAVNLRLTGQAAAAYTLDSQLSETMETFLGADDTRTLNTVRNLARDLYELGRYRDALTRLRAVLPVTRQALSPGHLDQVRALHDIAISLRKLGAHDEALAVARENHQTCQTGFGPDHEATLAAMMAYANSMRALGDATGANSFVVEALTRYRRVFGERNPLTLAAATNHAIILRALGRWREAYRVDDITHDESRRILGMEHPHTLAAAVGLATDLAHQGDTMSAATLGRRTLATFRQTRGDEHPDTWICAVNLATDLRPAGDHAEGNRLAIDASSRLRALLGAAHPDVAAAEAGRRLECDVEPPPT